MNTILIMIATTAIFFIGIKTGYNLNENKQKKKEIKTVNKKEISQADRDKEIENSEEKTQEQIMRLNKIMTNIDNFNGKIDGQVDID